MIPDNSGINYVRMLLFVFGFLVSWKIAQILANPATPDLLREYKAVTSMLSKGGNNFKREQREQC